MANYQLKRVGRKSGSTEVIFLLQKPKKKKQNGDHHGSLTFDLTYIWLHGI